MLLVASFFYSKSAALIQLEKPLQPANPVFRFKREFFWEGFLEIHVSRNTVHF